MRLLAVGVLGAAMLLPASAIAYQERPPIGEGQAMERVQKFLRANYPGWRFKQGGFVECRGGRVNRYSWSCRVAWWGGYKCRQGRVRITNQYAERGVVYYNAHIVHRRC